MDILKEEENFSVKIDVEKDIEWVSEEAKQEFIKWSEEDAKDEFGLSCHERVNAICKLLEILIIDKYTMPGSNIINNVEINKLLNEIRSK